MLGEGLSTGGGVPGADVRFYMIKISISIPEIIEWRSPKLPAPTVEGSLAGGFHVAFEAPDMEAVYATLCGA